MTVGSTSLGEICHPKIDLPPPIHKDPSQGGRRVKKETDTPHRDYRAVAIEMMPRYSRISQKEIGKRCGNLDYSAVSRQRARLRENAIGVEV